MSSIAGSTSHRSDPTLPEPSPDSDELKRIVGGHAAERVSSGMTLGLGTGSTVAFFLERLGDRVRTGELVDIRGVPTSIRTKTAARRLGIPLVKLHEVGRLDLTVDGADEVDPDLELIKGMGGALLREKMVAQASDELLIVADDSKLVERIGTRSPLPVEVVTFGWRSHVPYLESLGGHAALRVESDGDPYVTDNGNYVLDTRFIDGIEDPHGLHTRLLTRAGVVEVGLFLGMATEALIAGKDGVRTLVRSR